jgi:hypothetical protein
VIEAKTPQAAIRVESDDVRMDARCVLSTMAFLSVKLKAYNRMLKDDRAKIDPSRSIFNQDLSDRVG